MFLKRSLFLVTRLRLAQDKLWIDWTIKRDIDVIASSVLEALHCEDMAESFSCTATCTGFYIDQAKVSKQCFSWYWFVGDAQEWKVIIHFA